MKRPWPSIARTVFGDHERYLNTYMRYKDGYYFTGDGAQRDADGYYWITGRVDGTSFLVCCCFVTCQPLITC
jgi:acetyl-CoA synthetase